MTEPETPVTQARANMLAILRGQMSNHPFDFALGWVACDALHQAAARSEPSGEVAALDFQHEVVQRNIDLTNQVLALRAAATRYFNAAEETPDYKPDDMPTPVWDALYAEMMAAAKQLSEVMNDTKPTAQAHDQRVAEAARAEERERVLLAVEKVLYRNGEFADRPPDVLREARALLQPNQESEAGQE